MAKNTAIEEFHWTDLARVLYQQLGLAPARKIVVAYSGGLDSSVLLHALVQIPTLDKTLVTAAHVNHGLHSDADHWQASCEKYCRDLDVTFVSGRVQVTDNAGQGIEAAAREARYRWLEAHMPDNSVLLTAHHRDDQAETVVGRLLRGAGVLGLGGIPVKRELTRGLLLRPMLTFSREALNQYALIHGVEWIEDPSNNDSWYSRNYLRQRVLPIIEERWPRAKQTLATVARNLSDAAELIEEVAKSDLRGIDHRREKSFFILNSVQLTKLSQVRRINAMRFWFRQCGFPMPDRYHVEKAIARLVTDTPSPTAVHSWRGAELRRYKEWLYLSSPWVPTPPATVTWNIKAPLTLPARQMRLVAHRAYGEGLDASCITDTVRVDWRRGGERVRIPGRKCRHQLRKLFQEAGVPPWIRGQIPLIYVNNELAAVVGYWTCEPFVAKPNEPGIIIRVEDYAIQDHV